jgi:hypothetical protein
MYHHLPLQSPPKFTQIWIFGLKTNHLATLPVNASFWANLQVGKLERDFGTKVKSKGRGLVVSSPFATEEIGAMGREIEYHQGIGW